MSFVITDWNINPNQDWYVKLSDNGDTILVQIYDTEADMIAGTDLMASAEVVFGVNQPVILTLTSAGEDIELFNSDVLSHLKVTGVDGDDTKYFHLSPFVDMNEISNSIYRSEGLILRRATHEINKHTHITKEKQVSLATLIDGVELNDRVYLNSASRGSASYNIVTGFSISGSSKGLVSSITVAEYSDFVR